MDKFKSIRPFGDHEIKAVLDSLSNNETIFKLFIKTSNLEFLQNFPFVKSLLKRKILKLKDSINNVDDLQQYFKKLVQGVIDNTINQFSYSGLEHLDPNSNYLFISNHRDITLDPALLNFVINNHGHKTSNIAVGNNLMSHAWAANLMRLNKSFIIQRDGSSKKDVYEGLNLASEFINVCLENNESVWIAQRQGRAKDGIDTTDPAILKMIQLARRKSSSTAAYFNKLKVVPVSIAYEYDPNDILKAKELAILEEQGRYDKHPNEDLDSIVLGINQPKGDVHISIQAPMIFNEGEEHKVIAEKITSSIVSNYKIQPSNIAAYSILNKDTPEHYFQAAQITKSREYFQKRMAGLAPRVQNNLLLQYANPIMQVQSLIN